jgi:hypothetical protein
MNGQPMRPGDPLSGLEGLEELPSFELTDETLRLEQIRDQARARRIPVDRTDTDVLISIANLLEEVLAVQRHMLARISDTADSRSSVEIATNSKGTNITCKAYSGSDIEQAESAALESYLRLKSQFDGAPS